MNILALIIISTQNKLLWTPVKNENFIKVVPTKTENSTGDAHREKEVGERKAGWVYSC